MNNYLKELKEEFKKQYGFMRENETEDTEKYKMWDVVYENIWYFIESVAKKMYELGKKDAKKVI